MGCGECKAAKTATRKPCLILILLVLCAFAYCDSLGTSNTDYFGIFTEKLTDVELHRIVYDQSKGSVYVAGTDKLYSLSRNLVEQSSVGLGPFLDNINCGINPKENCAHRRTLAPFIPRALVIDESRNVLITCGTVYYGSCHRTNLLDFSPLGYVYKPVVPNDETKSVTAFAGPGINSSAVLYVGASYSGKGDAKYRSLVNFITVRDLGTFDVRQENSSWIKMLPEFLVTLPVEFVGGFHYNGYIYFFATHKSSQGSLVSYSMRICANDTRMRSFVELPLVCSVAGVHYPVLRDINLGTLGSRLSASLRVHPDAMFGVFVSGETGIDGAVCVYSMKKVEEGFANSVSSCFRGSGKLGPNYLVNQKPCTAVNVAPLLCGENIYNQPISSDSPLLPVSSVLLKNVTPTSIVTKTAYENTVAYVGVKSGKILKLKILENSSASVVYGTVNLDVDSPQQVKDLILVLPDAIYALTAEGVHGIKAINCEAASASCSKCTPDPHCGWCVSSNRCSLKNNCASNTLWFADTCPTITELTPSVVPRDKFTSTLFVANVNFIPSTRQKVECQMSGTGIPETVRADVDPGSATNKIVRCGLFTSQRIVPDRTAQLNLSLTILVDNLAWAKRSVTVYDCQQRLSCGNCTLVSSLCKWCISQHRCLSTVDSSCANQGLVDRPTSCLRIEQDPAKKLLIASGVSKDLQLIGYNIMRINATSLKCRFVLDNQAMLVDASYVITSAVEAKVTVTCRSVKLQYSETLPSKLATVDLVWGNNFPLDKPANMTVDVYKCQYLASSCGQCLLLGIAFNCSWCKDVNLCAHQSNCIGPKVTQDQICPNPRITSLIPVGGPPSGGTALTIKGDNLGKVTNDVTVSVGGTNCPIIPEKCQPPFSIVCKTGSVIKEQIVDVVITVNQQYRTPPFQYVYKKPVFLKATPMKGPCAGGTRVTMTGENLDYGSDIAVTFFTLNSQILWRNSTHLELLTPYHRTSGSTPIMVKYEGGFPLRALNVSFICIEDVVVSSVVPTAALMSGGNILEVIGSNLDCIQKPQMIVYVGPNDNVTVPCKQGTKSFLQCFSPDLRHLDLNVREQISFNFGFVMDNITELLNLQSKHFYAKRSAAIKELTYYADPKIARFPKVLKFKKGDSISIQGERVGHFAEFKDAVVKFGGTLGSSLRASSSASLTVTPPEKPLNLTKDGKALVTISLGNYHESVGEVSYTDPKAPIGLIVGLVLGILFAVFVAGLLVWYFVLRRRKIVKKKKKAPPLRDVDRRPPRAPSNAYIAPGGSKGETTPLRAMEAGNDRDCFESNGVTDIEDDEQFFEFLLKRIENPNIQTAAKEVFIARERLELGNLLGKGHFGRVYAATLRDADMKNPNAVAVKTIEDSDLDHQVIEKFLHEGIIMKNFNHPHVLSLIGLCLGYKKEPMVILPFMANGDLRTFVKDQSKEFTARRLMTLAQQVAGGMSYLSGLNFIHRDLAARNCMIDDRNQVKVADFGLSHELHNREYYRSKDQKARLPIKWMALESLENFFFTTKSDVWSFGVLMWELMTRGIVPYPDVDVFEIRNYLASGRRLRKPQFCPDEVYSIMLDCWQALPEARPTFTDLVNRIELLLNPQQSRASSDSEPNYLNVVETSGQEYLKPVSNDSAATDDD